jgi:hypothetical protein
MHGFQDTTGRTWAVVINVAAVKRVRGLLNLDLYSLVDDGFKPLAALVADPVRLADVLYCLCRDEAEARHVSDEDFGRALAGDALLHAADALVEELVDFFPDARTRDGLTKVLAAGRKVRDAILAHATTAAEAIDPAAEARRWIASSGTAPGSSASTPDRSPSGSSS